MPVRGTVTLTVVVEGVAPFARKVSLASTDDGSVPSEAVVPAGESSGTFTFTGMAPSQIAVTAAYDGLSYTMTITVVPEH